MLVPMKRTQPVIRVVSRIAHSTGLRLAGFVWMLSASLLMVIGAGLGLLGVGGHLLVRTKPETGNVLNYDPSNVASFAPFPFAVGFVMAVIFLIRAHLMEH